MWSTIRRNFCDSFLWLCPVGDVPLYASASPHKPMHGFSWLHDFKTCYDAHPSTPPIRQWLPCLFLQGISYPPQRWWSHTSLALILLSPESRRPWLVYRCSSCILWQKECTEYTASRLDLRELHSHRYVQTEWHRPGSLRIVDYDESPPSSPTHAQTKLLEPRPTGS